jgi:hypothetical protein
VQVDGTVRVFAFRVPQVLNEPKCCRREEEEEEGAAVPSRAKSNRQGKEKEKRRRRRKRRRRSTLSALLCPPCVAAPIPIPTVREEKRRVCRAAGLAFPASCKLSCWCCLLSCRVLLSLGFLFCYVLMSCLPHLVSYLTLGSLSHLVVCLLSFPSHFC